MARKLEFPSIIVPKLVTGCKIWHLRDESDFFTKANFEAAMKSIPDGSTLLMSFGEIDCREGLLVAVERMRYADLAAGIEFTISIYIAVLKKLAAQRKFTLLVHPVPPVLNETRHIVKQFNAALQAALAKLAHARIRYLDFFEQMLSADGEKLADGLALDGTHLHPDYVRLVAKAVEAVGI